MYRNGVLCIDAVEISTDGGHVVALGLPQTPFPLGGEVRDVIEDVRRLGGMSIVAHPDSTRPSCAWSDWDAPFDGHRMAQRRQPMARRRVARARSIAVDVPIPSSGHAGDAARSARESRQPMGRRCCAAGQSSLWRPLTRTHGSGQAVTRTVGRCRCTFRRTSRCFEPCRSHCRACSCAANAREDAARRARSDSQRDMSIRRSMPWRAPAILTFTANERIARRRAWASAWRSMVRSLLNVETNAPAGSIIRLVSDGQTVASGAPPVLELQCSCHTRFLSR